MAVTSITDISYRAGGTQTASDTVRETTLIKQLIHTSDTTFIEMRQALGVFPFVSFLASEPDQLLRSLTLTPQSSSRTETHASLFFSNAVERNEPEQENPTLRDVKIDITSVVRKEEVSKDRDSNAITNSAGDFFEDKTLADAVGLVLQFQKNFAAAPAFLLTHPNTVNSAQVTVTGRTWTTTFPAETLKFQSFRLGDDRYENGIAYAAVTFDLEYRRGGWATEKLDRGFNAPSRHPSDPNGNVPIKVPFEDANGNVLTADDPRRSKVTTPWLLRDGLVIDDPSVEAPSFLTFNLYDTADFTTLPGVA